LAEQEETLVSPLVHGESEHEHEPLSAQQCGGPLHVVDELPKGLHESEQEHPLGIDEHSRGSQLHVRPGPGHPDGAQHNASG
jgi:hypothetical protein